MTKRKRKLIFHWIYREWGGAQIYFLAIIKLALPDWDILVVIPQGSSPEIVRYLDHIGAKYEFIDVYLDLDPAPTIKRKLARHWSRVRAEIASIRFLRKFKLSECILHVETSPWASWMYLTALSLLGANVFVTLHNALPTAPAWRVLLWKIRMQFVSRLPGFHIFTSNKDTKNSFKGWIKPSFWDKIPVTYTCVNPSEIDDAINADFVRDTARIALNIEAKAIVVLCVGQFIDRKGRWTFLDAAKIAAEKDRDLQFVWVAPGLPSAEDAKHINDYHLGDNFRLVLSSSIGSTRQHILRFFRIADIFALPSFVEGLPIALLEAMAIEIPSISTNINAIPEAIIDGETGILIDVGDAESLADQILRLKADPELRMRLSKAGRAFVIEHFDEREASRIAIDAYKECFTNIAKPERTQARIFKNGIYSVLSWVFPIIFAVIVTPVVVRGLGVELYGLFGLILGFISYSFTFGIGKIAAKYVAEYRASGDYDKISESVSAALWLSFGIGIIGAAIVAITADRIVSDVLFIKPALHSTAVAAIYLAAITIPLSMLSQVFQSVVQGLQRFDRFVFLTNLSVILLNLGSVAIVLSGYGVLALLVWNLSVVSVIGVSFYVAARRLMPQLKLRFGIAKDVWRASGKYALSIIIYQVFANILLLFERAWIVRKFGFEALTFYIIPMMVGLYFHSFVSSLILVIFPVINELLADQEKLKTLYQTSSKIILTLTGFFLVTAFVTGRVFLTVWMHGEFPPEAYWILVIHVITFSILSVAVIAWQMNESHRLASLNAIVTILWLVISAPLMVAVADRWNTVGIAVARLAGVIVFLAMIVIAERKFLGGVLYGFWLNTLTRLAVGATITGLVEWAIIRQFEPGWAVFVAAGLTGACVYAGVLLVTGYLKENERELIVSLIGTRRNPK